MGFFDWLRKHFPPCDEEMMDHDPVERYQAENPQACGDILPPLEEVRVRRDDKGGIISPGEIVLGFETIGDPRYVLHSSSDFDD